MRLPYLLALLIVCGLLTPGCSDSLTGPEQDLVDLPALEPIPYEALGQGLLAFERIGTDERRPGGLYVIDVEQRTTRGIGGKQFNGPALSPDGQRLLYTRLRRYDPNEPNVLYDVYMAGIDGRNEQRLTNLEGTEGSPAWLPDGQAFVFHTWPDSGIDLYRQPATFSPAERILIHHFPQEQCPFVRGPISASASGHLLLAMRFCGDLTTEGIYTASLDGGPVTPVVTSPGVTAEGAVRLHAPAWSPDGQYLAYVEVLEAADATEPSYLRTRIRRMDADGTGLVTLATLDAPGHGEWAALNTISLCWSPDGARIAFNHREGTLTSHIYVVGRDGDGLQRITSAPGVSDMSLSWVSSGPPAHPPTPAQNHLNR